MFKLVSVLKVESPESGSLMNIVYRVSSYAVLRGVFARYILASKTGVSPKVKGQVLTAELYSEADRVIFLLAMPMSHALLLEEKLTSLAPSWEKGLLITRGRLGTAGLTYLGPDKLVILHPKSRLALLILKQCHEEDHKRTPSEAVYRSRKIAWIHRAKSTAIMVTKNCAWCIVHSRKMQEQRMADLPKEIFEIPTSPWTNITLDFMAPVLVRAMTNKRAKLKTWPLVLVCMNTSALTCRLCPGYDTESFLVQLQTHIAVRGQMKMIYSDSGSQLKSAKVALTEYEHEGLKHTVNWSEVQHKTASQGIQWKLAPPESQWRDGRSERAVGALKSTLRHLHDPNTSLNFAEMQCLLDRCCDTINNRPLGVSHHNGEDPGFSPVTPNLLLKGARSQLPTVDMSQLASSNSRYTAKLRHMDNVFMKWWHEYEAQVFSSLAVYPKWSKAKANLSPGDICLLRFDSKVSKPDFRLCTVLNDHEDEHKLVRTVEVLLRPRDQRERALPYVIKDLVPHTVSIQRLVLLYSAKLEAELVAAGDKWPLLPIPQ